MTPSEQDLQDQLDAEWAYQQSLDEEQELLSLEEQRQLVEWHLECEIRSAIDDIGEGDVGQLIRSKFPELLTYLQNQ